MWCNMSTEASDPCEVVGCFLSKWSNKNAIARSAPRERIYRTFSLLLARARSSSCFFHFLPPIVFAETSAARRKYAIGKLRPKRRWYYDTSSAEFLFFVLCPARRCSSLGERCRLSLLLWVFTVLIWPRVWRALERQPFLISFSADATQGES